MRETLKYINSPDLDFVQDKILDFFKNQTLKNAIVESVEVLENGNDLLSTCFIFYRRNIHGRRLRICHTPFLRYLRIR